MDLHLLSASVYFLFNRVKSLESFSVYVVVKNCNDYAREQRIDLLL